MSKLNLLFGPHAKNKFAYVDLNGEAIYTFRRDELENPLLDAEFCEQWIKYLHRRLKCDVSYGGYMENRSFIWRNSYLGSPAIHLGVDVNCDCDSAIYCPVAFKVLEIVRDLDQNGGWGERLLVETRNGLVIFAHLAGAQAVLEVGKSYPGMTIIGFIAGSKYNGGWFPHLHLQGVRDISLMEGIDGYYTGSMKSGELSVDYPNPFKILDMK